MDIFSINCGEEWHRVVENACKSDFYHTYSYHALSENRGEGIAHLFVHREGEYMVALPLLLRPLEGIGGIGKLGKGCWDATSVYGYAGPIASHSDIPEPVLTNFRHELAQILRQMRVISVFSRLHPLIRNEQIITGLGDLIHRGRTVSIDLTLTLEEQWRKFRSTDRRRIRCLRRGGYAFVCDEERRFLPEFVALYTQTMERVGAEKRYFFDEAYFRQLLDDRMLNASLCLLLDGDTPICGGVFLERCGIVEYHLGGTRNDYLPLAPAKLLVDEVRLWAAAKGYEFLHLGGGVGAGEDGLLHFKQGFSDLTHAFMLWQWIVNPDIYAAVCRHKRVLDACRGVVATSQTYFPCYRCPVAPIPALLESNACQ